MVKKCIACGSTNSVQAVYDTSSEEGEWRCPSCINERFPPGSRVVKFTDTSHPLRPAYYMKLESEDDLDAVLWMGERAQKIGAKGIKTCFYTAHKKDRRIGPMSFSLGHADSIIQMREHIDKLRLWLETSDVIQRVDQRDELMENSEDSIPLFAPINPEKHHTM